MTPFRLSSVISAVAYAAAHDVHAAEPPTTAAEQAPVGHSDLTVMSSHVGHVVGQVVKISPTSITLSVPETVVTGVKRIDVSNAVVKK